MRAALYVAVVCVFLLRTTVADGLFDNKIAAECHIVRPQATADVGLTFSRAVDDLCEAEVLKKLEKQDALVKVLEVVRSSLNCDALSLRSDMKQLSFEFDGTEYTATKQHYHFFPKFGARHSWTGALRGGVGAVTVTWNDACDPGVFTLQATLPDGPKGARYMLRSLPCEDLSAVPNCTWLVKVQLQPRDEFEGHPAHRRAIAEYTEAALQQESDAQALDDDVELLQLFMEGDPEVQDYFTSNGGVHLPAEGTVVMPSGRQLDDGTTVRVLYLYTHASRDRWGDDTIRSMIVGGVASTNQAFNNSGIDLTVEAAAIHDVPYIEVDHVQALSDLNAGVIPNVAFWRDTYQADLVQLIVNVGEYCGYGNVMQSPSVSFKDFGFSVVYNGCYGSYSHIHELGHNMGAQHDPSNNDSQESSSAWPFGVGYRYCEGVEPTFSDISVVTDSAVTDKVQKAKNKPTPPYYRSMMSYSCAGATRVPYFSSPNIVYENKPTGTAEADNVRVLQTSKYYVANFR